jgi:6-pyruvoyltetrahydropterin/6-carboxytetrahydropterin synthase
MLELSRTVRFCLSPDPGDDALPRHNTFAAWPPMRGLGRYYELTLFCQGEADPKTGYFINIKHIDNAVRDHLLPILREAITDETKAAATPMGLLMQKLIRASQSPLNASVKSVDLSLTSTLSLTIESEAMSEVLIKQQYDFSAAHRLHVPDYDDTKNREIFGKCNNPAGHGHNYRVEVVARCPIDEHGCTLGFSELDRAVDQFVIEKLDHKHLNHDVAAFAELNPSVEHIVRIIWDMLDGQLPGNAKLHEVTVWETEKTACTYRGY